MNKLEDINFIQKLYDTYGELLTTKQQYYFENYYFDDLSLSEIAENSKVSRNAVHSNLQTTLTLLHNYEEKLKVVKNDKILKDQLVKLQNKYHISDEEIDEIIEVFGA